jgi:hypothetical protein
MIDVGTGIFGNGSEICDSGELSPPQLVPIMEMWYIVLFATNSEQHAWWDVGFWLSGKCSVSIRAMQPIHPGAMQSSV